MKKIPVKRLWDLHAVDLDPNQCTQHFHGMIFCQKDKDHYGNHRALYVRDGSVESNIEVIEWRIVSILQLLKENGI